MRLTLPGCGSFRGATLDPIVSVTDFTPHFTAARLNFLRARQSIQARRAVTFCDGWGVEGRP